MTTAATLVLGSLLLGAAPAQGPEKEDALQLPVYAGPRKRAVVTAMEVKVQGVVTTAPTPSGTTTVVTLNIEQPTEFGTGLTDMLTTALVQSSRFVVLDRQNMEELIKESDLTQDQRFNPDTAVVKGKLLGAQVLVRGAVTELAVKKSGSDVGGVLGNQLSFGMARSEALVAIDLKIVDVATGQVLDSVKAEGKAVSRAQQIVLNKDDIKIGNSSFENSPLGKAVRQAINDGVRKICEKTASMPWEAKVAAFVGSENGGTVYLNVGVDSGLLPGDSLEVFRPGEEIVDPDTQIVIGRTKGEVIGKCQVAEVQERLTLATATEGSGFQRGDVVRFVRRGMPVPSGRAGK